MSASTDREIVEGCLDPKNWGCGKATVLLAGLAVAATAAVCVLVRRVMDDVL